MISATESVEFHFYRSTPKGNGRYEMDAGSVRHEGSAMIIEIPYEGGMPYVVVGRRQDWGGYEGRHEGEPDDGEIVAKWNTVGDRWVGIWIEEGDFNVFTFKTESKGD